MRKLESLCIIIGIAVIAACGPSRGNRPQATTKKDQAVPVQTPGKLITSELSPAVSFLLGKGTDQSDRTLFDLWKFKFSELESHHDYIQWMFPTVEKSAHNSDAPVLTLNDLDIGKASPELQNNLRTSLKKILRFYGFNLVTLKSGKLALKRSPGFQKCTRNWVSPGNHNFLRVTRILKCLRLFGMEEEAQAFFSGLDRYLYQNPGFHNTVRYSYAIWKSAAEDELLMPYQ